MATIRIRALVAAAVAVSAAAGLAACGAASHPGRRPRTHTVTGQTLPVPPGNRAAAQLDTSVLLGSLRLPTGSSPRVCPGPPHIVEAINAHALAERCFTVSGPGNVYAYIMRHRPRGAKVMATGSGGGSTVIFSFPAVGRVLGTRLLSVTVSAGAKGSAAVYADAQSDWLVPRPAAERVPGGVSAVVVTDRHRTFTVTEPSRVAGAVRLFDSLPVVQPGAMSCPEWSGPPPVVVDFTNGRGGRVIARARFAGYGVLTACDPIHFSIRGKRMSYLTATKLRSQLRPILGVKLP